MAPWFRGIWPLTRNESEMPPQFHGKIVKLHRSRAMRLTARNRHLVCDRFVLIFPLSPPSSPSPELPDEWWGLPGECDLLTEFNQLTTVYNMGLFLLRRKMGALAWSLPPSRSDMWRGKPIKIPSNGNGRCYVNTDAIMSSGKCHTYKVWIPRIRSSDFFRFLSTISNDSHHDISHRREAVPHSFIHT